jgi:hypothetical protein
VRLRRLRCLNAWRRRFVRLRLKPLQPERRLQLHRKVLSQISL